MKKEAKAGVVPPPADSRALRARLPTVSMSKAVQAPAFEHLKGSLLNLTQAQRLEVLALLNASPAQTETGPEDTNTRLLYDAVVSALQTVAGARLIPFPVLVKRRGTELRKAAESFDQFLRTALPGRRLQRNERLACYQYLARLVLGFLHELQLPLTLTVVLRQASNVGQAVDHAFPGYAHAGVLGLALTRAGALRAV